MEKKKGEENREEIPEGVRVKVVPVNLGDLKREYVNFAHISHGESEFTIDFVDVTPPNEFEIEKIIEKGDLEVPIKFRLVCNAVFVELLIAALEDNLRKFRAKAKKNE
jgi:hypothetical protein